MSSNEETNRIDVSYIKLTDKEKQICEPSINEILTYYTFYPIQFFRDIKNMSYKNIFLILFTFIVNLVIYYSLINFIYKKVAI